MTLPNGLSITGTASGGQALLVSVDGCGFVNPASLIGHVILFQAKTDKQLLSTVTGRCEYNSKSITLGEKEINITALQIFLWLLSQEDI